MIPEFGNVEFEATLGEEFKTIINGLSHGWIAKSGDQVLVMRGSRRVAYCDVEDTHNINHADIAEMRRVHKWDLEVTE